MFIVSLVCLKVLHKAVVSAEALTAVVMSVTDDSYLLHSVSAPLLLICPCVSQKEAHLFCFSFQRAADAERNQFLFVLFNEGKGNVTAQNVYTM